MSVRVAAVAWKLDLIRRDSKYFGHFHDLVSEAHDEGAEIVVFPELHVLELVNLAKDMHESVIPKYLVQYADSLEEWIGRIARSSGLTIVGGTHFRETSEGIKNVCCIALPSGERFLAEKNNLTSYERLTWGIVPGTGLRAVSGRVGVTICYDVEFPASARALAESGVLINAVPSYTETQKGFQRVRWCCLARAVENQNYVVHSTLVGNLGYEPVSATYGSSAIISPSIEPFPDDPVLRETPLNEEGVIVADLDFAQLDEARSSGPVANWEDRNGGDWSVTLSPAGLPKVPGNGAGTFN